MELKDSILDFTDEEDSLEYDDDAKMNDIEEGELVEKISRTGLAETGGACTSSASPISCNKKQKRRKKKKKNKRQRGSSGPKVTDINRFVLDVCRRLKERKSYLIWTAVGCLGVSALSDLVKELYQRLGILEIIYPLIDPMVFLSLLFYPMVDAVQTCGGQKTVDGKRFRTGGGILWGILKVRDPNAYKEIMKKGREFEKQFKQAKLKPKPLQSEEACSERFGHTTKDKITANSSDVLQHDPVESNSEVKRVSVHDRIRTPITYDDLFEGIDEGNPKDLLA